MLKLLIIGLKDLKLVFRDRAALVFMLLTPFLLTLGMGLVTGRFSSNDNSGALNIPIVIVNLDNDSLGDALVEIFHSPELADLVEPTTSQDAEAARHLVDEDEITAAIIIPKGFTQDIFSENINQDEAIQIEFYANPSRPTSAGIVKTILDGFMARVDEMRVGAITSVAQLIISGRISPEEANQVGEEMGVRFESNATEPDSAAIKLQTSTTTSEANEFDSLAFLHQAWHSCF